MNSSKLSSPQITTQERSSVATPASPAVGALAPRLGNHYLQQLLESRVLQAKLTVSDPGDAFEQEADRVADQVMRTPEPVTVQRQCDGCEELRRTAQAAPAVPRVDPATENSIATLSGRGSVLPDGVRGFMEPRFNADFSAVRIHNDAHAHELARTVNAQAFTVGRNVVFGAGHYAPDTESGRRLLAHELTHVVQQRGHPAAVQRQEDTGVEESTPRTIGQPATIVRIEAYTNEIGTVRATLSDGSEKLVHVLRNTLEAGQYNISPAGPREGPKDAEYMRCESSGFAWRQQAADSQRGDVVKVVIKLLPEDRFARLPQFIRNFLLAGKTHVSLMEMARLAEEGEALLREGTTEEILALAAAPGAAIEMKAPPDLDLVESLRRRGFSDFPSREEYYRRLAWQLVNSSDYRRWWTQADIEGYWKEFPEQAAGDWEEFAGKRYEEAKQAEEVAWLKAFRRIDAAAGVANAIAVGTIFVAGGFAGAHIVALPSVSIPALPATIGGVKTAVWARTLFAAGVSSSFLNHIFNRSKEAAATEGGSNPISIFSAAVLDTSGAGEVFQAATNESLLTGEDLRLSKTERAVGAIKGTAEFFLNVLGAKDLLGDPVPQVHAPAKASTQPPPEPTPVAAADTKQSVGIAKAAEDLKAVQGAGPRPAAPRTAPALPPKTVAPPSVAPSTVVFKGTPAGKAAKAARKPPTTEPSKVPTAAPREPLKPAPPKAPEGIKTTTSQQARPPAAVQAPQSVGEYFFGPSAVPTQAQLTADLTAVWQRLGGRNAPTIVTRNLGPKTAGHFESWTGTYGEIVVNLRAATPGQIRNTVWHEAMHARIREIFPWMAETGSQHPTLRVMFRHVDEIVAYAYGAYGQFRGAAGIVERLTSLVQMMLSPWLAYSSANTVAEAIPGIVRDLALLALYVRFLMSLSDQSQQQHEQSPAAVPAQ